MKRATETLDSAIVFVWSFLFFFAALVFGHNALPSKWQPDLDTNTLVEISTVLLCVSSAIRFLAYMMYPQWMFVPAFVIVVCIYWLRPGQVLPWRSLLVAGTPATLVVILGLVLLHRFVPFRIKWQKKISKSAKAAQQAMALKSLVNAAETGK